MNWTRRVTPPLTPFSHRTDAYLVGMRFYDLEDWIENQLDKVPWWVWPLVLGALVSGCWLAEWLA